MIVCESKDYSSSSLFEGQVFKNGTVHVASWAETTIKLVREMADWFSQDWIPQHPTRWAPTSCKWRYDRYKYRVVTPVSHL